MNKNGELMTNLELVSADNMAEKGRNKNIIRNHTREEVSNDKKTTFSLSITPSDLEYGLFTAGPARDYLPDPGVGKDGAIDMILIDITDIENIEEYRTTIYYPKPESRDIQIRGGLRRFFSKHVTDLNGIDLSGTSLSYEKFKKYVEGDRVDFLMSPNDKTKWSIKYIKPDRNIDWDVETKEAKDGSERMKITIKMFLDYLYKKFGIDNKRKYINVYILDNDNVISFKYFSSEIPKPDMRGKEIFEQYSIEKIWYVFCLHTDIQKKCDKFIIINGQDLKEKLKNVGPPGTQKFMKFIPNIYANKNGVIWDNPEAEINVNLNNYLNKCESFAKMRDPQAETPQAETPQAETPQEGKQKGENTEDFNIIKYIDDYEFPENISDSEKEEIKAHVIEERDEIEAILNENKSLTLKSKVDEYYARFLADKEEMKKAKEKEKFENDQKKKEEERRSKIDKELDIISKLPYDDIERMLHNNKNVDLDGPPYVGKTYSAIDCAVRYISRFIKAETDDKLNEFISKGYIEIFPSHPSLDYSDFVEGYKYDSGRPVLKPGILKIMSSRALGSVIRLDDKNKNWEEIYSMFKEKKKIMSKKEIGELFKYAIPLVLVITDFTRGDVVSILGPTNTIIDKPYRLGETDGMPIFLRDSGEEFGIPSNLYIIVDRNNAIGTSISHLDEATERRFPTKFMSSNFDDIEKYINDNIKELESKGTYDMLLNSKKAMIKLNKKIIKTFGKDKELGHCYLYIKTPYELFTKWKNLIIPLLFRHRCRRDYKDLNNLLFNDDDSQWISNEEGVHGLNNIEDLKSFIDKINSVPDQNE